MRRIYSLQSDILLGSVRAILPCDQPRSSPQNRVTKITDLGVHYSYSLSNLGGRMDRSTLGRSISKLAIAGEQAGFTVEQMIQLLNDGLEVSSLISLIHWKLDYTEQTTPAPSPYRWVC